MVNALLLSNSTLPGTQFFTWPRTHVKAFLGEGKKNILFNPFAAVTLSYDEYEYKVSEVFSSMGYQIKSLHRLDDKSGAIEDADAIVTGGGNTFALLHHVYQLQMFESLKRKLHTGTPYIGWSAGANLGCPTIMTTNDMPVVQPLSLAALNLVPFQINPHYHELKFDGQGGETRKERLNEFIAFNPHMKVIGLPEGMLLQRNDKSLTIKGETDRIAKLYRHGSEVADLRAGDDLSFLLTQ